MSNLETSGSAPLTANTWHGLIKELEEENEHWSDFLKRFGNSPYNQTYRHPSNIKVLEMLKNEVAKDEQNLEPSWLSHADFFWLLPYRNSNFGIELHRLFESGKHDDAKDFLIAYFIESGWLAPARAHEAFSRSTKAMPSGLSAARGFAAFKSIEKVNEIVPLAVSHQKISGELRAVRNKKDELDLVIAESEKTSSNFHSHVRSQIEQNELKAKQELARLRTWRRALRNKNKRDMAFWNEKFNDTHTQFFEKLKYEAPVDLWRKRAKDHKTKSRQALIVFQLLLVFCLSIAVWVAVFQGDFISDAFVQIRCIPIDETTVDPKNCSNVFSPQGVFLTSTILLVTSLSLWVMRLQSKIYLSERHLALDAEERMAFAQTFLALKADETVSSTNEAIVLSSLFRPTQDGIIKDDEGALDLSAAAIIAKSMQKPSS